MSQLLQIIQIILTFALSILLAFPAIAAESPIPVTPSTEIGIQKEAQVILDDLATKAIVATQKGDFPIAESYWTEIIKLFPDNAAAWSNRGNAKSSQNHLDQAIADYTKAIELAPFAPDPYLNRGATLQALNQAQEAIADYAQRVNVTPLEVTQEFTEFYAQQLGII
jgi:tetratricopeptide (TPR) repeat protein